MKASGPSKPKFSASVITLRKSKSKTENAGAAVCVLILTPEKLEAGREGDAPARQRGGTTKTTAAFSRRGHTGAKLKNTGRPVAQSARAPSGPFPNEDQTRSNLNCHRPRLRIGGAAAALNSPRHHRAESISRGHAGEIGTHRNVLRRHAAAHGRRRDPALRSEASARRLLPETCSAIRAS